MSLLKGQANISTLFKSSRDLSSEHWLVQVLVNAFGVEAADAPFYLSDDTGISSQPDPGSNNVVPEHRIFHLVYKSVHDGLSGARLAEMERQLVGNLNAQIAEVSTGFEDWTDISDLYGSFLRSLSFRASIVSLCGSRIWDVVPTLEEDFWAFDGHLPTLFKEVPRWLAPESYNARDKMKENVKRWHIFAHDQYDVSMGAADERNWEEVFGSRLMRTRHEFFRKMPLSKSTLAADDLGLIWAYAPSLHSSAAHGNQLICTQGYRECHSRHWLDGYRGPPAPGNPAEGARGDCAVRFLEHVGSQSDECRHRRALPSDTSPVDLRRGFATSQWHSHQSRAKDCKLYDRGLAFSQR